MQVEQWNDFQPLSIKVDFLVYLTRRPAPNRWTPDRNYTCEGIDHEADQGAITQTDR